MKTVEDQMGQQNLFYRTPLSGESMKTDGVYVIFCQGRGSSSSLDLSNLDDHRGITPELETTRRSIRYRLGDLPNTLDSCLPGTQDEGQIFRSLRSQGLFTDVPHKSVFPGACRRGPSDPVHGNRLSYLV